MDHPYRIIFIVCAVITVGAGVLRRPDVDENLREHPPEQATGPRVYDLRHVPGMLT